MWTDLAEKTLAEYRKKGLAARAGFGVSPAVIVIDAIVGFTDTASPLAAPFEKEIGATVTLLDAARRTGAPVIFTTVAYDPGCEEALVFMCKIPSLRILEAGSRWVEVDPRLGRKPHELLLSKKFASAFFGTHLSSYLVSRRVDTLVLAGFTTSGCVRATAVDALQHGLRVIVPSQCVGDRAEAPHIANLIDIDAKYGDVVSLEDAIQGLEKSRQAEAVGSQ